MAVEPTPEELIEQPAETVEVERETRMTPAEATARMRIRVPTRGNRKLRSLIERVNADGERKARELLAGIYEQPELAVIVSEALHAITSHRAYGKPLTLEAGVLRVADALDMAKGRSRIPFERGSVSIHALSAAAIDSVKISDGDARPIMIEILMTNSSGVYQVDGLLKEKLRGSGLEPYVEVVAHIDTEAEKRLVPMYRLET